jgi:hypothetical protein
MKKVNQAEELNYLSTNIGLIFFLLIVSHLTSYQKTSS